MLEILTRPLTEKQMRKQMDANGYVEGIVPVELEEIVDMDRSAFLVLLSELLTDSTELEDVDYELVGHDGSTLHLHVTGDATSILEDLIEEADDDEEEEDYE
jgi:hypothetical protein